MAAGLSAFTLTVPTRGQQAFRAARDAWRAGRGAWQQARMDERDAKGVRLGTVSDDPIKVGQMVSFVSAGAYKVTTTSGVSIEMTGLKEWAASVDAEYRAKLLEVVDAEISAFVFWVWREWPVSTGWSKSLQDYRWTDSPSGPIVTYMSQAPYSLIARGTRRAFAAARSQFGRLPLAISARMEGYRNA